MIVALILSSSIVSGLNALAREIFAAKLSKKQIGKHAQGNVATLHKPILRVNNP